MSEKKTSRTRLQSPGSSNRWRSSGVTRTDRQVAPNGRPSGAQRPHPTASRYVFDRALERLVGRRDAEQYLLRRSHLPFQTPTSPRRLWQQIPYADLSSFRSYCGVRYRHKPPCGGRRGEQELALRRVNRGQRLHGLGARHENRVGRTFHHSRLPRLSRNVHGSRDAGGYDRLVALLSVSAISGWPRWTQ